MSRLEIVQLIGMTQYEFRMHWRRKMLLFITLILVILTAVIAMIDGAELTKAMKDFSQQPGTVSPMDVLTYNILFGTWVPIAFTLALVLPIAVSDTIPLDKLGGMGELLDSLPITPAVYLSGKVAGTWLAVASSVVMGAGITAIVWWLAAGAYRVDIYLEMWILGGIMLAVLNGSLGVLLAAGQPNRRRAIVWIIVLLFGAILVTGNGFASGTEPSLLSYLNPMRAPIMMRYTTVLDGFSFFTRDVMMVVGVGLVQLISIWLLVWGWLRWKERTA